MLGAFSLYAQQQVAREFPAQRSENTAHTLQDRQPADYRAVQNQQWKGATQKVASRGANCPMDTLLFEDFQSQEIPASWINLDLDMNTDANDRPMDWYISAEQFTTMPGDTNWVATSSSWFNPFAQANNWLILEPLEICDANVSLIWQSKPFEGLPFMDGYKVLVSTTDSMTTSFTDTIFVAAEDVGGGQGIPGPGNVHPNFEGDNGLLSEWRISLEAYEGQRIFIAFVHDSDDDNLIQLDDIFVGLPSAFDIALRNPSKGQSPYTITPLRQVQPLEFSAAASNQGAATLNDVELRVDVQAEDMMSVFQDTARLDSLVSGAAATLTTAPYTPDTTGNFTAFFAATSSDPLGFPEDDVDTLLYAISDSVYARDDNQIAGNLSIGEGTEGLIGQSFDILQEDRIRSISAFITAPVVGQSIVGEIYTTDANGTPDELFFTTEELVFEDTIPGFFNLPILGGSLLLDEGTYVVVLREAADQSLTLAYTDANFQAGSTWVFFQDSWSNSEDFNFLVTYLLRINLNFCVDPQVGFAADSIAPLTYQFSDLSQTIGATSWSWDFGDGNTSTEQNPAHEYAQAGDYTVCLTVTDSCASVSACDTITVETTVGIEQMTFLDELSVFPNPASSQIQVSWHGMGEDFQLSLSNALGQSVWSRNVNGSATFLEIPVSHLPGGLYELTFQRNNQLFSRRILVSH